MSMYTDPNHIRVSDPGKVEGNTVFIYLDAFGNDKEQVINFKEHYKRGGLGDIKVKRYLNEVIQAELEPIRKRRFKVRFISMSLLIENGTIVTASDIYIGDIYIEKGKISEIVLKII